MPRVVLAVILAALLAAPAAAAPSAPGAPGSKQTWAAADKHGFGTARDTRSNVWFTLRSPDLTEVYYPDLTTPALRELEFVVSDGRSFADRETGRGVASHVSAATGSLTYTQTTSTRRWRLTKTWITDPSRATVLARVHFQSLTHHRLRLYVVADPAPGNDGDDDRARSLGSGLAAWDSSAATYIAAAPRLEGTTSGYAGRASDPRVQLASHRRLTHRYDARRKGNVIQAARTRLSGRPGGEDMTLAVGFGRRRRAAQRSATASLHSGFTTSAAAYAAGWSAYLGSLRAPPAPVASDPQLRRLYEQSVMVLAASEDKLHRGGSVASPTMPWVWGTLSLEKTEQSGPYHLVWPRDLYQVATAQEAAGDDAAVMRELDYLWSVQKPDGSWWQNTNANGTPHWKSLQLDEVALPVVLAWWTGRTGPADWAHVRKAADFIRAKGPKTEQERWENQSGWSPNTIAAEIAGLVCAADIARRNGDPARAAAYDATADDWQAKVDSWTATTNGPYSPKPYYLRITKDGKPNTGTKYSLGDNHPHDVDQRAIVDQSFLGLVLLGVKRPDDPVVQNSLAVGDKHLRVDTPNGPGWHRFSFDGYGETATGGNWNVFKKAKGQTMGRVWPLLSGERGEYELLRGQDASAELKMIASSANDGLMLPEQVWDGRPPTGTGDDALGTGTRSGTPLAWTHAQFVRLAWSMAAGTPIERPSIVACRYAGAGC